MLYQLDITHTHQRTYEQIGHRVKEIISDPKVQRRRSVTISRLPNESPGDWGRLLNEIAATAGIRVEPVGGDGYRVAWRDYYDAEYGPA